MTDLNNPMRFSVSNGTRTIDIGGLLSDDRRVTSVTVRNGNLYVHWEHRND